MIQVFSLWAFSRLLLQAQRDTFGTSRNTNPQSMQSIKIILPASDGELKAGEGRKRGRKDGGREFFSPSDLEAEVCRACVFFLPLSSTHTFRFA